MLSQRARFRAAFVPFLIALFLSAFLLLACLVRPACAHKLQVEPVVAIIRPQSDNLSAEFVGNVQDITQTVDATDKDSVGDGYTKAIQKKVEDYFNQNFVLTQGGTVYKGALISLTHQAGLDPGISRFHLFMRYPRPKGATPKDKFVVKSTMLSYLPNARVVVSVGGTQKTLSYGDTVQVDPSALVSNLLINLKQFVVLGIEHIFTGPDHMLFMLALLLVAPTLKNLVKTLTGFTIAHSITLILSALSVVVLPEKLTDILIAVSIVYVGLENIFLKSTKHRFWIASGFGLVHGFGFSGVLREIGLPSGLAQVWCLLSFNVGVEIAQLIICGAAFPLLMAWRKSTEKREKFGGMSWRTIQNFCSIAVTIAGAYWLMQRVFG